MNRHQRRAAAKSRRQPTPTPDLTPTVVKNGVGVKFKFYDLKANWTKWVEPHLADEEVQHVLVRDFNYYTYGRWGIRFEAGDLPHAHETCDWWCDHKGPIPRFWQYVKHGACHWLVNFNLRLANLVLPDRPWRIVTSDVHSTVWDGDVELFDFNGLALFGDANKTYVMAHGWRGNNVPICPKERLPIGAYMETDYTKPYMFDELYRFGDVNAFLARLPQPAREQHRVRLIKLAKQAEEWNELRAGYGQHDPVPYEMFWARQNNAPKPVDIETVLR